MKVHHLLERQLPKAEKPNRASNAPYMFLHAMGKFLQEKDPTIDYVSASVPFRVWTRGDGYRYKDAPYMAFKDKADKDKAWAILTGMKHTTVTIAGPFGSERNEGIVVDDRAFVNGGSDRIYVYSKSGIDRSKVMKFIHNDEDLLLSIIKKKLDGKKPLRISVRFKKDKLEGVVTDLDGRMLTIKPSSPDGLKGLNLPLGLDQIWTIKDIDGIPTLVAS